MRAPDAEALVKDFVVETLADPAKLEARVEKLLDEERDADGEKLGAEMDGLKKELEGLVSERLWYQKYAARGHITVDELVVHQKELDERRARAEGKLARLRERVARINRLEVDRAVLLEKTAALAKTNLVSLEPEDMRAIYGMLKLRISPSEDGLDLEGVFCDLEGTWSGI